MTTNEPKTVHRSARAWIDPSPEERLAMILEQMRINDLAPESDMWLERDTALRRRKVVLMAEIAKEEDQQMDKLYENMQYE